MSRPSVPHDRPPAVGWAVRPTPQQLPLRLGLRRWPVSLTEGAVAACLLVGAGAWSVVAVGLGVAVAQGVRRCPRRRRHLDLAVRLLATTLAQALCAALGGGVAAAATGVLAFWLVTCTWLAGAVAATSSSTFVSMLGTVGRRSAVPAAGSTAVGLLAAWLALEAPLGLVGLLACGGALWAAYDTACRRHDEARLLGELASGAASALDDRAAQLVTATARLLGGADVDLVVLAPGGAQWVTGDERTALRRSSSAPVLRSPWVLSALAVDGLRLGREQGRPCLTTVLRRPGAPLAVLRVRRPHGAADFGEQDRRLVDVVLGQVAGRLAPRPTSDLVVPDVVLTAPSPAQDLRASVDRLDRMTGHGAGVDELAEELHELSRAAASLLGSQPRRPASVTDPRSTSRPAGRAPSATAEWTTTGVLR